MEDNNSFLGRGWAFPVQFLYQGSTVQMVEGDEDIRQSLELLLGTMRRERVLLPDYGMDLKAMIFEPLTTSAATALTSRLETAIIKYEPRINLNKVNYRREIAEGTLLIELEYTIVSTNTRTNLVFPFYLDEGTDL